MSDRAQMVLDALMECKNDYLLGYPFQTISEFLKFINSDGCNERLSDDYESLSIDEEKQVIKAFLEFAY